MRHRNSVWTGPVLKGREPSDYMNLPNDNQWDETICSSAMCQHPQCWASLRRIERGHPRILDSSSKFPREIEDKLPTLTIVNIMDTCLWTKNRVVHRQSSEFTFPKERHLLSKPAPRCHYRSRKVLYDKGVTSHSRPPKLSVLNLNEAKLPFSEDVRNMVVTWVPEDTEKNMSSVGKTAAFSRWPGKKRKKLREKTKPSLYFSGRQYAVTHSTSPGVIVPPPSPVHLFGQLNSEGIPLWTQVGMLPQDLLKECILAHEKTMTCPEVKIELAKMRQNLPLEKTRPDSAISSKMYLTVHRLTLQRPSLRYPEHLRKLQYSLKTPSGPEPSGFRKQPQRKVKISTKKQETKKKAKSDVQDQYKQESKQKLEEQEEEEKKAIEKHVSVHKVSVSTDDSVLYDFDNYYTDYSTSPESPLLYEPTYEDSSDVDETMLGMTTYSQESSPRSISGSMDTTRWNPELKLLRILQASVEEDEEKPLSRTQSEVSLDA
ncbi:LOC500475 [Phodopus roborovskii]|uniref:LOC500475 protein n=1 Tax=Phodopus roborovskii TaxID=109678 RepID=A0AAU9ZE62_PHORO|nr:LOC500475 [Phodopus roborovskii]